MIIVAMFVRFIRSENEHIQLMDSIHSFHSRNMTRAIQICNIASSLSYYQGAVESYESDNFDTIIF